MKSLSFRESEGDKDISKYKRILESDRIDMKTLRSMAWRGIPSQYRAITWKLLLVGVSEFVLGIGLSSLCPKSPASNYSEKAQGVYGVYPPSL